MVGLRPDSIVVVLGTRPEIIKLAFVIKGLGDSAKILHTGQHYDETLSRLFLDAFELPDPARYLDIGGKSRAAQVGMAIQTLGEIFEDDPPEVIVVQGDTNTTLAGAIAANAYDVPLVHVEAGLRSHDRRMPEEHNRVLTDHLADLLCAPTPVAVSNARGEGIPDERIELTGNTIVEAVHHLMPPPDERAALLAKYGIDSGGFVLSTFHRPENVDDPARLAVILQELTKLDYPVLLPLHPRSRQIAHRHGLEYLFDGIQVVQPIGYREFLGLSAESAFLISDSGGVQEECSVYKRPVIVVRRSTERPEVLETFARLVAAESISDVAREWLDRPNEIHQQLAEIDSPYGDGSASERIVEAITGLGNRRSKPDVSLDSGSSPNGR